MKKNILAENMLRFGTKNLSEANLQDLENIGFGGSRDPKTGNTLQLSQEDMVTFNGKQHAVLASAYDKASIEPNDSFTANKIREAGANPVNWVLLQATPGPYDSAYDDLGPDQLRSQWDYGSWMFAPTNKLQPASAGAGNTLKPRQQDMVTFNGKQHAVLASAWDKSSIDPNDTFTASKIRQARANADNWVLLQKAPGSYDSAYDDLGPSQLRSQWDYGSWMFVSADKLQPAGASTSANLTDKSWEGFLKAIANKINTDANDPRTNLTSAEIDSAYEKFNLDKKTDFFFGPWKQYTNGNTNAVDRAIQEFFPKVK